MGRLVRFYLCYSFFVFKLITPSDQKVLAVQKNDFCEDSAWTKLENAYNCIQSRIQNDTDELQCKIFTRCIDELTPIWNMTIEKCYTFDIEEKYSLVHIIQVVRNVIEIICTSTGSQLIEFGNPCVADNIAIFDNNCTRSFHDKWKIFGTSPKKTKIEFCSILNDSMTCMDSLFLSNCNKNKHALDIHRKLIQSFSCK